MPIENEIKYLLDLNSKLESKIGKLTKKQYYIEQSYVGKSGRIRLQRDRHGEIKRFFTFKQIVENETVEIEKKIDFVDYELLSKVSTSLVKKTRYDVDGWEIDFFKVGLETYFVMAEIELPRGVKEPSGLPDFIKDNLIYVVDQNDLRFSSKKISDVEYAKKILEEIKKEKNQSIYRI